MNLKVSKAGFAGSEEKNNANTTSDVKKKCKKINIKKELFGNKHTHGN